MGMLRAAADFLANITLGEVLVEQKLFLSPRKHSITSRASYIIMV